jgi:hypothetical protein
MMCLILSKMFNQFVAYSDVQDALIFKRFRLVHVRFEFEIAVSWRFKASGMLCFVNRETVAVVSKVGSGLTRLRWSKELGWSEVTVNNLPVETAWHALKGEIL